MRAVEPVVVTTPRVKSYSLESPERTDKRDPDSKDADLHRHNASSWLDPFSCI